MNNFITKMMCMMLMMALCLGGLSAQTKGDLLKIEQEKQLNEAAFQQEKVGKTMKADLDVVTFLEQQRAGWLTWCNDALYSIVGANNYSFGIFHRFAVSDLTSYAGQSITKVKFMPYNHPDYPTTFSTNPKIQIYVGGSLVGTTFSPGTLTVDYTVPTYTFNSEQTVNLPTPLLITGSQEVWIGIYYTVSSTNVGYPGCSANGAGTPSYVEGKSNIFTYSGLWASSLDVFNPPNNKYSWTHAAYVELLTPGGSCNPPTALNVAYASGCGSAQLTWTAPTGKGGSGIGNMEPKSKEEHANISPRKAALLNKENQHRSIDYSIVQKETDLSSSKSNTAQGYIIYPSSHWGYWKWNVTNIYGKTLLNNTITDGLLCGSYYDGKFYAYGVDSDWTTVKFYTINATTGAVISSVTKAGFADMYDFEGMAYDPSTNTMRAILYDFDNYGTDVMATVNLTNGNLTNIVPISGFTGYWLIGCAIDQAGTMYVMDFYSDTNDYACIYTVNKTNGNATLKGATGVWAYYDYQSMAFDHSDNQLYWCASDEDGIDHFMKISTTNGAATMIQTNTYETTCLHFTTTSASTVSYNVYRDDVKINSTPVTTNSYADNTFTASVGHTWAVKAICEGGGESNAATKTMPACSSSGGTCDDYIIGTGTSSVYSLPLDYYTCSYSQQIYLASEINFSAGETITEISFQFPSTPITKTNQTIYLTNTTKSTFSTSGTDWVTTGLTQVYQGTVNFTNTGTNYWCTIELDTPFEYTGDNIIVSYLNSAQSYTTSFTFRGGDMGANRSMYIYNNSSNIYNPLSPPSGYYDSNRSNIKFKACTQGGSSCVPTEIQIGTSTVTNSVYCPIIGYYNYTYSQFIYDAADLGGAGSISSLSLNYNYTSAITYNNVTIYLGNTTKNAFASATVGEFVPVGQLQSVYTGTMICPSGNNWVKIEFDTDFSYTGDNLLVTILCNNGPPYLSGYRFNNVATTVHKTLQAYNDDTPQNPASPSMPYTTYAWQLYRPNIKFDNCVGGGGDCNPATNLVATYNSDCKVDLTWTAPGGKGAKATQNFSYTGAAQPVTLQPGTYEIEVWGADGGPASKGTAGKGGYSKGTLTVTAPATYYVYVGGKGITASAPADGGWNGGGAFAYQGTFSSGFDGGTGGGGTDVRSTQNTTYANRIIVAGGGGGAAGYSTYTGDGGNGGGLTGADGTSSRGAAYAGKGGTQTAGGAAATGGISGYSLPGDVGVGGNYVGTLGGTAGGGGWYGGGSGHWGGAAGAGSGYIGGVTGGVTIKFGEPNYVACPDPSGNGYAKITGDGIGGGDIKYNVYRDGIPIATNITTTSYTDTNNTPATGNTWEVKVACDGGGESAPIEATLGPCNTCYPVTDLEGTYNIYCDVELTWGEPGSGGGGGGVPGSITTPNTSNNGSGGVAFDVIAGSQPVTITAFETPFTYAGAATVHVYYREGTACGNAANPAGWILVGQTNITVTTTGNGNNTYVDMPAPLTIPAGQTYGLYIATFGTSGSPGAVRYYTGSSTCAATTVATNSHLTIKGGHGITTPTAPFGGTINTERNFCGTIYYTTPNGKSKDISAPQVALPEGNALKSGRSVVCDDYIIGTGTGNHYALPSDYFQYSYAQQIYLASEIEFSADETITEISFQYTASTPFSRQNMSFYLANTTQSTFSGGTNWITTGLELVYQGNIVFNNSGTNYWYTIELQTPFIYTGNNIVVVCLNSDGSQGNTDKNFYTHTASGTRSLYYYSSSTPINPMSPPSGYTNTSRNNVKFKSCAGSPVSYNIYRDGDFLAEVTDMFYTDLHDNFDFSIPHTWSVTQVCEGGESDPVEITLNGCVPCLPPTGLEAYYAEDCSCATISWDAWGGKKAGKSGRACEPMEIQIGASTSTNSVYCPIIGYYNYIYSQFIYDAADLGGAGSISSLSLNYNYTSATTYNNVTIYLGNTTKDAFASATTGEFIPVGQLQSVYTGNMICPSGNNWVKLEFDTNFEYTGDNLLVAILCNNGPPYLSGYRFNNVATTAHKTLQAYNDDTPQNPASPSMPYTTYAWQLYRPNIKFDNCVGGIIRYNVYRDGIIQAEAISDNTFTDCGFTIWGYHTWEVTALCEYGESDPASITLVGCYGDCEPPYNLEAEYTGIECNALLTWDPPLGEKKMPKASKMTSTPVNFERGERNRGDRNGMSATTVQSALLDNVGVYTGAPYVMSDLSRGDYIYGVQAYYGMPQEHVKISVTNPGQGTTWSNFPITTLGGEYYDEYYYCSAESGDFYKVNHQTGAYTLLTNHGTFFNDLTYNYATGTMYGLRNQTTLYTINLSTGAATQVATLSNCGNGLITIACSLMGDMYGIEFNSSGAGLYSINVATGACTLIGPTGTYSSFAQGSTFDHETGIYYWCNYRGSGASNLFKMNLTTGAATAVNSNQIGEICGAYMPYVANQNVAKAPNPFTVTPLGTLLKAKLAWTNPTQTLAGDPLANGSISSIVIQRDGAPVYTSTTQTGIGQSYTWTDNDIPTDGNHCYSIYVVTSEGNGSSAGDCDIFGEVCTVDVVITDVGYGDDFEWYLTDDETGTVIMGSGYNGVSMGTFSSVFSGTATFTVEGWGWYLDNSVALHVDVNGETVHNFTMYNIPYGIVDEEELECIPPIISLYNIYRDGVLIEEEWPFNEYLDETLNSLVGHEWCVRVACQPEGESVPICTWLRSCGVCDQVTDLVVVQPSEGEVTFTWIEPDVPGFHGMKIIRDGVVIAPAILKPNFTYTDYVSVGSHVYCFVALYLKIECAESPQTCITVNIEEQCDPINEVLATIIAPDKVKVSWVAPDGLGIINYSVYCDNVFLDNTIQTFFIHEGVTPGEHVYGVEVNYNKPTSECTLSDLTLSNPVIIETCTIITNLQVTEATKTKITIKWNAEDDVETFDVYRNNVLIANVEELTYADEDTFAEGVVYTYCVVPAYHTCQVTPVCVEAYIEPCVPINVTNIVATGNQEAKTAYITWDYVGADATFDILKDGKFLTNTGNKNYTDNIEYDITYKYCVKPVAECVGGAAACDTVLIKTPVRIIDPVTGLAIYPNPASTLVIIEGKEVVQVDIYNVVGQLVETLKSVEGEFLSKINVSTYESGTYVFKIYTSDKAIVNKPIVIHH